MIVLDLDQGLRWSSSSTVSLRVVEKLPELQDLLFGECIAVGKQGNHGHVAGLKDLRRKIAYQARQPAIHTGFRYETRCELPSESEIVELHKTRGDLRPGQLQRLGGRSQHLRLQILVDADIENA